MLLCYVVLCEYLQQEFVLFGGLLDSRFKKLYCPFKNILKTEIFLQSHIK